MTSLTNILSQPNIATLKKVLLTLASIVFVSAFVFSILTETLGGPLNFGDMTTLAANTANASLLKTSNMTVGTTRNKKISIKPSNLKKSKSKVKKKPKKSNFMTVAANIRTTEVLRPDFNQSSACPLIPPHLKGRQKIKLNPLPTMAEVERSYTQLLPGGRHIPLECTARQRVAIVIPFRDREQHLATLLYYLHLFLQRQQLEYGIYIVEQAGNDAFNRGALLNVGFLEALKLHSYECFIFHDVDLIPEDDRNLYICLNQPKHVSVAVNTLNYRLPYETLFGGVCAMATDQFKKVNGFSNLFLGWGGEDDDMSWRVTSHGYKIQRYPSSIARYTMLPHTKQSPNPKRKRLLQKKVKLSKNGLSTITYKVLNIDFKKLYTLVKVSLRK